MTTDGFKGFKGPRDVSGSPLHSLNCLTHPTPQFPLKCVYNVCSSLTVRKMTNILQNLFDCSEQRTLLSSGSNIALNLKVYTTVGSQRCTTCMSFQNSADTGQPSRKPTVDTYCLFYRKKPQTLYFLHQKKADSVHESSVCVYISIYWIFESLCVQCIVYSEG